MSETNGFAPYSAAGDDRPSGVDPTSPATDSSVSSAATPVAGGDGPVADQAFPGMIVRDAMSPQPVDSSSVAPETVFPGMVVPGGSVTPVDPPFDLGPAQPRDIQATDFSLASSAREFGVTDWPSAADTPVVDGSRCGVFDWDIPADLITELSDLLTGVAR